MRGPITLNEKEQKRLMILNKVCRGDNGSSAVGPVGPKSTADATVAEPLSKEGSVGSHTRESGTPAQQRVGKARGEADSETR